MLIVLSYKSDPPLAAMHFTDKTDSLELMKLPMSWY